MDPAVRVAVVQSDNRRGAVAEALALIADDVPRVVAPHTLIKPNLVSHKSQLPSTHADTLSCALDFVLASGAERVTVAEGASDAHAGFERMGYHRECWGRPVSFFDINRDEADWEPLELVATDGTPLTARLSRTVATADCRVSLALMKTHVTAMVTHSLKNMLSSIHPADRVMMHGHRGGGNGYRGLKGLIVEFLKGDNPLVRALTRGMGHARRLKHRLRGLDDPRGWEQLSPSDLAFLGTVVAMTRNLVRLNRRVKPHLSVVDGFVAMHGEGPRHGTPAKLGVVVAGADAVAVDAVSAAIMGFQPRQISYLTYAETAGLGVIDLDAIQILGDPLATVRRRLVPHSNFAVQRHWDHLPDATLRGPHVRLARRTVRAR
jgi:uncharacterized protein (DUF362 family)